MNFENLTSRKNASQDFQQKTDFINYMTISLQNHEMVFQSVISSGNLFKKIFKSSSLKELLKNFHRTWFSEFKMCKNAKRTYKMHVLGFHHQKFGFEGPRYIQIEGVLPDIFDIDE